MSAPTDDTEFDLCADSVTLDYNALQRLALVSTRHCLEDLHACTRVWYSIGKYPTNSDAKHMLEAARDLYVSTVALHYLTEGMDRDEIMVVREPKQAKKEE